MIFNLKRVLVGKDYFKINHFLPLSFNLAWGCTLLGKNIVPRPALKQFLLRCLKQFTIYIWRSTLLAKMKAYLRKIVEVTGIKFNLHMIMGWDLCKINKHFLQFPCETNLNHVNHLTHDKLIYHKNLFNFFPNFLILTLGKHCWYTICLIKPTSIRPLMWHLLSPMNTHQKRIII
jgi:hypothetical protein